MTIKVSSAKAKGRRAQQIVRDAFLSAYPTLTEDDIKSCPMGSNGADIQLSTAAKAVIPYDIEVKARAKIALVYDALEQAKRDDGRTPLAVIKADRKRPLVVIDLDHFMKLLTNPVVR